MRLPNELEVRATAFLESLAPFAMDDLLRGFEGERAVYPPGLVDALLGTEFGRWCVLTLSDGRRAVDFAKISSLLLAAGLNALGRTRAMEALHNQAGLSVALAGGGPAMHSGRPTS